MYKAKKVTRNIVDLFYGEGWYNCARIRSSNKRVEVLRTWGVLPKGFIEDKEVVELIKGE